MTPIVSVIITTFNRLDKLKRAFESVGKQTLRDIEIIIVDNASEDGTVEWVKAIQDPRLIYIRQEQNLGGPAARNIGIKRAKASLIAFLDDDDQWMPTKLVQQVDKINQMPQNVGIVYVGSEIYDETTQVVINVNQPSFRGDVYQRLLLGTILSSVSSVLIRTSCFEKVGLFDEGLTSCQDWDMWLRLARNFEFDYVPQILVRINMHGAQISTDYNKLIPGRTRMIQKHEDEFKQYPNIYSVHLKRLGKLHCINGTWPEAMSWFQKAVAWRPLEIFKITAWIIFEWPKVVLFSKSSRFKKFNP